jgi:glycosyltransferase involved in cell wall biosynthesis
MAVIASVSDRVVVDGKFFRLGHGKFYIKGLTYGPFVRTASGERVPSPREVVRDFAQILELGANLLHLYYAPPRWFLDLASEHGLKLLIDTPWRPQSCFLDSETKREEARAVVGEAAVACAMHPAVLALSVLNEIPADIVRWSGAAAVEDFIDESVTVVKSVDPNCLCTFGNYPPTEFLNPQNIDFVCFNVYLHNQKPFENYLARLQSIADRKPLILGEYGIDSLREGETRQREILEWQTKTCFCSGLAGAVIFSFTDEWYHHERPVLDWAFGLVTRDRRPKPAFAGVQKVFHAAPSFPLARKVLVSVVVACYNGERTLKACLDSLERLNYPAYEIILVDDGSSDGTAQIAALHKRVRYLRQENLGLSAARNAGIRAAAGEIIAFTDADCRADEDWLYYLAGDLLTSEFAGMGGHNFLPPEDSWIAAAVMVSPGGPAHVMLTDREAEHIPGCNMAFYKWALDEVGGFDPIFRKAGDDVDLCWRLQQRGYKIGFSPGGFVWHYRRSTVRDYLKQQRGYGDAEALLVRKHPEYFNAIGGSLWQGRIYSPAKFGILFRPPMIYRGLFGSGFFQSLYAAKPVGMLALFTSLEYYVLVTLPLLVVTLSFGVLTPLAVTSLVLSLAVCIVAAAQADIPKQKKRFWSRPLVALMFFLQPIVRGAARYQGRLNLRTTPLAAARSLDFLDLKYQGQKCDEVRYWSERYIDRLQFVARILKELDDQGWPNKADAGWNNFDMEIFGSQWSRLQLTTVTEVYDARKQMIRCRLRAFWSLPAHILFWSALCAELLIIGFLWRVNPWLWLLLLSMPIIAGVLRHQQRDSQRQIAVFLDKIAEQFELQKLVRQAGTKD